MEVEKVVTDHPGIAESGHRRQGRRGRLERGRDPHRLRPRGPRARPAELTLWLAERMPYFMVPRYIRFVHALPKTPTERVQKVPLREGITADTFDREAAGIRISR